MEHDLQFQIVSFLRLSGYMVFQTDVMDGLKFCGNNQNMRMAFINHHKKMGYIKGQSDLIVLRKGGECVFAELKTKKGVQSREQKDFQKQVESLGFRYYIWRDVKDVAQFVKDNRDDV